MKCPILNPIKFYDSTSMPNWTTRFPNNDNITQRVEYISGLNPVQYYKEFLANKTMVLQFEKEIGDNTILTVKKFNTTSQVYETDSIITASDITPSGWIGQSKYSYSKSFLEGTYYLTFSDGFRSDVFTVISDNDISKRLVEVKYKHAENDYSCIFDNDFEFLNYFQGQLVTSNPENEIEAYKSDRGEQIKLQATPIRVYTLNINELHQTYIDHLNMIFSLDQITINGIEFENTDQVSIDLVENTDLCNATVKLYIVDNDYFYKK